MKKKHPPGEKKIRITLDLTPQAYERLGALEDLVDASTKAHVIRQALQVYEYLAERAQEGYAFRAISPSGEEETLVFVPLPRAEAVSA